jgi:hypothetical protein
MLLFHLGILALVAVPLGPSGLHAQQDFDFDEFERRNAARDMGPAEIAIVLVFYGVVFAVVIAIQVVICFLLFTLLKAVPQQFRSMEPGMVWLILIPLFNIVWIFFVYIGISKSYQNYFRSLGRYDVGDCGESLGLWYCICTCLSIIPCVGPIAGVIGFVLMIIYFVRLFGLKGQIQAGAPQPKWSAT